MSCGCSNNINYPNGCGNSSCTSCTSVSCEQVVYSGPNLLCAGIDNEDNLCIALQKLDDAICNVPITSITASNGLYKTGSDIRMGGALIEPTVISASAAFTMSLTGLVSDPLPDYLITQTTFGLIRRTPTSTLTSNILALITADNGITKTLNNFQLGGSLVKPTTITATGVNTLSIPGLVNNPSATYIVSIDNATGLLTKSPLSTIVPPNITADNGLTKTGANVQLGGSLIIPTTITTGPTNTLTFAGLSTNTIPTYLLTQNGFNVTTRTLASSFITADNGLTKTGNNIQLGGTLIQDTLVDLDSYKLSLLDSGAAPTGIVIIPGAADNTDWTTTNTNRISGKTYHNDHVWINGNKSLTIGGSTSNAITGDLKLDASKSTGYRNQLENGTASIVTYVQGNLVVTPADDQLFGSKHALAWLPSSGNPQFLGTTLAASFHEFVFEPHFTASASSNNLHGKACAIAARGYFVWGNDLDKFTGIRIQNPQADGTTNYTGTVTEMVGLEIEDQRGGGMDAHITTSYGIKQMGAKDTNYINGPLLLPSTNTSIGTATLVAGTATVLTASVKTGSKIFISRNTVSGTLGHLSAPIGLIANGISFVINSSSAAETSTINWWVINN